jgi:hypothetical protein
MRKSPPSFARVFGEFSSDNPARPAWWTWWLVRLLGCVVLVYLAWLGVMTVLRVQFPWDLYMWPESPFMTNMLKLELGQPLFGPPADGNSFVYSPGLEYLTYAVLKPLGLHLDIRYCRVVNVAVGVMAAVLSGLALRRAVQFVVPENQFRGLALLGGGLAALVIFKNFTADVTHPDNLVMLHTAGVFLLTLWAWREKKFSVALIAMLFAGLGVFAKQILALAFLGPALVFVRFNPWGWRRWLVLVLTGGLSAFAALTVMTWSPDAKFYLLKLLPSQGIHLTRFYWMTIDLVTADRAFLLMLGLIAVGLLWRAGRSGREYLQFCMAIGFFSVLPNMASYVKTMGIWNNLIIFQLWLLLLAWPALAWWLTHGSPKTEAGNTDRALFNWLVVTLLVTFVLLLFPPKTPAHRDMHAACAEIQSMVDADLAAGRKVLIGHGMMYLLRAGSREVPRDRANSILELKAAGMQDLLEFPERIRKRHYDRLYLTLEHWFPPEYIAEVERHYEVVAVVKQPECSNHLETGRYTQLIGDCRVLAPRGQ